MGYQMPDLACATCGTDREHETDSEGRLFCHTCGAAAFCQHCGFAVTVDHLVHDPHPAGVPGGGVIGVLTTREPELVTPSGQLLYGLCQEGRGIHPPHSGFVPVTRGQGGDLEVRWFAAACAGARQITAAAVSAAMSREGGPRPKHAAHRRTRPGVYVRGSGMGVFVAVDTDRRDASVELFTAAWQALTRAGYALHTRDDWFSTPLHESLTFRVYGPHHRVPRRRKSAVRTP